MGNRLGASLSPYLRAHADNPVDWYPWGDEAFAAARERDVPVLVSIGYATCHWCHVMARESFSDPAIAQLLNDRFVAIKVDREEHPDVDASYLADSVVLLRYYEADGEVRQAISVIKKRGGAHERTIRSLELGADGIQVGPALRHFRGILTGVPASVGAAPPPS